MKDLVVTKGIEGISVGINFVDAVTGKYIVHGTVTVGNATYPFRSVLDRPTTEAALKRVAGQEGRTIKNIIYKC